MEFKKVKTINSNGEIVEIEVDFKIWEFDKNDFWKQDWQKRKSLKELSYEEISNFKLEFSNIKLPYQLISNSSESQYIQKYENEMLHLAISKLPQKQKERIILRFFYRLTFEEISKIEKISKRALFFSISKSLEFLKKFLEWQIHFIGLVDHADTRIVGNKKARQINGLINEWYLEDLSENIKRTLKSKHKNGEYTGSFAPYGYLIDPKNKNHLIIDPIASKTVKEIFEMYAKGFGYIKIAKELNNRQILSPTSYKKQNGSNYINAQYSKETVKSRLWSDSTIYRMLRREVYTGVLVQEKSENISYKNKKRRYKPESEWIKNT